jgi:hypothetical protein
MTSPNWAKTIEGPVIGLNFEETGMLSPLEIERVTRKDKMKIDRNSDLLRRDCPVGFEVSILHI